MPAVVLQVCAELHEDGSDLSDVEREAWQEKVLSLILCHYFIIFLFIYLHVFIFVSWLLKRKKRDYKITLSLNKNYEKTLETQMVLVTQLSREDFVSDRKLSVVLLVTLSDLLIPIGFPLFYCLRLSKLLVFSPFFRY